MSKSDLGLKNKISHVKDKFFFVKSPFKEISTLGKGQAGPAMSPQWKSQEKIHKSDACGLEML
jgi:hypothetical protein